MLAALIRDCAFVTSLGRCVRSAVAASSQARAWLRWYASGWCVKQFTASAIHYFRLNFVELLPRPRRPHHGGQNSGHGHEVPQVVFERVFERQFAPRPLRRRIQRACAKPCAEKRELVDWRLPPPEEEGIGGGMSSGQLSAVGCSIRAPVSELAGQGSFIFTRYLVNRFGEH